MGIPDFTTSDVLKKINAMRATYKQEALKLKLLNATDLTTDEDYVSTWMSKSAGVETNLDSGTYTMST